MGGIIGQVMDLTAIFSSWLLLAIFLMVLIAEFGLSIPYLMETVWLFSGYNFAIGNITIEQIFLFCLIGLIGRIVGSAVLFYISWYSKTALGLLFFGYCKPRVIRIINGFRPFQQLFRVSKSAVYWVKSHTTQSALSRINDSGALSLFGRKFRPSPITVALGRFIWLRLPITIALGIKKQRTSLLLGVVIFSVVWDAAYIAFGVLGGKGGLEPMQMFLYPLGIMILISAIVFSSKRLRKALVPR